MNKEVEDFIKARWEIKFPLKSYKAAKLEYTEIKDFAPDGNIWETDQTISNEAHYFMRLTTQFYLTEAFKAMKMDLTNPNITEDLSTGNIGTPGRIAKVFLGASVDDTKELGNGRFNKEPRIASFPNSNNVKIPITKRIDVISSCSHHGIVFDTISRPDSYAFVSYIPGDNVLGISKLQSLTNHVSSRFFLQEDLTKAIYDKIVEAAGTESVMVAIINARHGCESYRSTRSNDGAFTSEYFGGDFKDPEVRAQIYRSL